MMIKYTKPINLNGSELRQELENVGVTILDKAESVVVENNDLWLDINQEDEVAAAAVVAAHNGTTVAPEPTIADKLASVGLSLDELKSAILGGN